MMEYELINPSDPYTFIAQDFETAVLVVFSLGFAYGAEPKEGTERVPILIFSGFDFAEDWYREKFGRTTKDGLEEKWDQVADALDSMMFGKFVDRRRYEAALSAIDDPEKLEPFKTAWQEGHSSCNNIGKKAHLMAKWMRENKGKG